MSDTLDKLVEAKENTKLESCILWVYDDAFAEGYGSEIVNKAAEAMAEGAAAELAQLVTRAENAEAALAKLPELAEAVRDNAGEGDDTKVSLLSVAMELDDIAALKGGAEMNNTLTEMLIENIKVIKLTQPAIAEIIAMVFMSGRRNEVDWKAVNAAIKERWSPSARGRVFTMAWKIAEEAYKAQQIEVLA